MNLSNMPVPIFVVTQDALHDLVETLSSEELLAIDTESNSMYVYRSRVCLIQVSTRDHDYIIDPLAIENMQPFGELMTNPDIEKVFHGAEYDLICLKRDFNFQLVNLFDTMLTARLLRLEVQGLADLLYAYFQIDMDKTQRLSDWGKRPLTIEMVHYARLDTHYLPALRDAMYEQLLECDALDEAYEIFGDATRVEPPDREFDPDGFWKIGRPFRLKRREMSILRELYLLREDIAREIDKPPNQMIGNKTLVALSQERPTNLRELDRIRGLSSRYRDYYADDILEAIEIAMTKAPGKPPPRPKHDRVFTRRYNALHAWRKEQAYERDLDSSIVMTKATLRDLAREFPLTMEDLARIDGIGEWRLQHYGKSLLKVIHNLH